MIEKKQNSDFNYGTNIGERHNIMPARKRKGSRK